MNNNLETLFQTTFQPDNTNVAEDWNVPSDRVWGGIEADLKKKKRRKLLLFILIPCLFASIGLGTYCMSNKQASHKTIAIIGNNSAANAALSSKFSMINVTKNVATPINTITTDEKNIDTKDLTKNIAKSTLGNKVEVKVENKSVSNANVKEQKKEVAEQITASKSSKNTKKIIEKIIEKTNDAASQTISENKVFGTYLGNTSKELTSELANSNVNKLSIINENSLTFVTKKLLSKEILSVVAEQKNNLPSIAALLPWKGIRINKKQTAGYALVVMAQPFLFKNRISSKDNIDFSGEKASNAFNVGLGLQRSFPSKNLFMELGLQYSQINYKLNYNINLAFNPDGETQNINGNFDNVYNGALQTSQGPLQMKMELQRQSGNTVIQGENILITAKGTEKLSFLRIPFSVGAKFASKNRFSFINKLSFNQLLNIGSTTQFSEVLSHHSAIKETLTQVQLSPKPNVWTPEIGVSMGVWAKLNRNITLGSELFYNKALMPMYKTNTFSNTPVNMGLSMYLKMNIK